jgi:hypothetical protein
MNYTMMMIYEHWYKLEKKCLAILTKLSFIRVFSENKQLHRLMHTVILYFTLNVDALFFFRVFRSGFEGGLLNIPIKISKVLLQLI